MLSSQLHTTLLLTSGDVATAASRWCTHIGCVSTPDQESVPPSQLLWGEGPGRVWPWLSLCTIDQRWCYLVARAVITHWQVFQVMWASVQNFCCHWKLPVIHKDCILLNSRNGIIFHLNLIIEIIKEWTDKYFRNVWMTLIILVTKHKRNRNSNLEPLRYNSMFTFFTNHSDFIKWLLYIKLVCHTFLKYMKVFWNSSPFELLE